MARVAGFLVQALLVMASFWLNMSHNPKILNGGVFGIDAAATSSVNGDSQTADSGENISLTEAGREAAGASESGSSPASAPDASPDASTPKEEKSEEKSKSGTEFINAGQHYVSAELAREEDTEIDESVSPKGGKLVSIPSVPVDVLYDARDSDDRFVGVSKQELARLSKRNAASR